MQNHSGTPKTFFTLSLECLRHIYSPYDSFKGNQKVRNPDVKKASNIKEINLFLKHSVTNMKFWYERISEYIRIEKNNTNECPNIFVSKKGYEYDTNEYSWRKIFEYIRISEYSTLYDMKNMIRTNIRIYSDQKNDTNEYTNIFVSKKGYEYDTNEYSWQKIFEYIRISEYSSHYDTKEW